MGEWRRGDLRLHKQTRGEDEDIGRVQLLQHREDLRRAGQLRSARVMCAPQRCQRGRCELGARWSATWASTRDVPKRRHGASAGHKPSYTWSTPIAWGVTTTICENRRWSQGASRQRVTGAVRCEAMDAIALVAACIDITPRQ